MSPRGVPRRVTDSFAERQSDRVRVSLSLQRSSLEQLEAIITHRRGFASRSAVVREAIGFYLAKQADWLLRAERQRETREARERRLAEARALPRHERDRRERAQRIRDALELAEPASGDDDAYQRRAAELALDIEAHGRVNAAGPRRVPPEPGGPEA